MYSVETERLILRPFSENDVPFLDYLHSDLDVVRYTLGRTRSHNENVIYAKTMMDLHESDLGHLLVIRKSDNRPIGRCGFSYFYGVIEDGLKHFYWGSPDNVSKQGNIFKQLELGYSYAKPFWGMGYAGEAAIAMKDYGYRVKKYTGFSSLIIKENIGSIKVAEKMGAKNRTDCMMHDRPSYELINTNGMING